MNAETTRDETEAIKFYNPPSLGKRASENISLNGRFCNALLVKRPRHRPRSRANPVRTVFYPGLAAQIFALSRRRHYGLVRCDGRGSGRWGSEELIPESLPVKAEGKLLTC